MTERDSVKDLGLLSRISKEQHAVVVVRGFAQPPLALLGLQREKGHESPEAGLACGRCFCGWAVANEGDVLRALECEHQQVLSALLRSTGSGDAAGVMNEVDDGRKTPAGRGRGR